MITHDERGKWHRRMWRVFKWIDDNEGKLTGWTLAFFVVSYSLIMASAP